MVSINVVDETFNLKSEDGMAVHFHPTGGWGCGSESPYIICMQKEWKYEHIKMVRNGGFTAVIE